MLDRRAPVKQVPFSRWITEKSEAKKRAIKRETRE